MSLVYLSAMNLTSSVLPFPDTNLVSATEKKMQYLLCKAYGWILKLDKTLRKYLRQGKTTFVSWYQFSEE